MTTAQGKTVVVTGDVTMDWNLLHTGNARPVTATWSDEYCTRACWQRGGAALLADLVESTIRLLPGDLSSATVYQMDAPRTPVSPTGAAYHHSYALWYDTGEKVPPDNQRPAWRVKQFLGVDQCSAAVLQPWQRVSRDAGNADLVVLDDDNLGFRRSPDVWPASFTAPQHRPWVVLKMARPVAEGPLWQKALAHASRLMVITTVGDIRLSDVQISRELSWERTAQDVAWELAHNPKVKALSRCAYVIVSFGPAGAVLYSRPGAPGARGKAQPAFTLIYDARYMEGMWEQEHTGGMIGYTTCLAASLARQLLLPHGERDLERGIRSGLAAMRTLHLEGYGQGGASDQPETLAFPVRRIAEALSGDGQDFASVPVPDPAPYLSQQGAAVASQSSYWTILRDLPERSLDDLAERIVLRGVTESLKGVPLGQFEKLITVDRREIESVRTIRALISDYSKQPRFERPLSIAVFGAPGSGKSFGITQVANSLHKDRFERKEFNLSQFRGVEDLWAALHQVRDVGLSGKIPLVFWDEFDTALNNQPLGWLRCFLAPMQDGKFLEGQVAHPIGPAIFVFAGGTCTSMEQFDQGTGSEAFRAAKGPDFISRLKGYANIIGPNPGGDDDRHYTIRRAILLRSQLEHNAPWIFETQQGKGMLDIDAGVLRAFLHTRRYRHGARSVEAIIGMSMLAGKRRYERSCLPPESQLSLHVDAQDFLALVQAVDLESDLLEDLVQAVHEAYCRAMAERGYVYGPKNDERLKTNSSLQPYGRLRQELKEQNRSYAQDIKDKLAQTGYVMVPARSDQPPFGFPGDTLERLAEMEHVRWVKQKIDDGWRYGPVTDEQKKLHAALLPWRTLPDEKLAQAFSSKELQAIGREPLPEEQKEKDRDLVRSIPAIVAAAGYAIVARQAPPEEASVADAQRPYLRIGVTGHRALAGVDRLAGSVEQALQHIEQAYPDRPLAIVSPLAEGGDRLAAYLVLARLRARLVAVLPLPLNDYMTDFTSDESRRELRELLDRAQETIQMPDAASREEAYEATGRYVLRNSDVLLALWDGQTARGPAGTGHMVELARQWGLPLAWVHAGNRAPEAEQPTSLGPEQGAVTFERFPSTSSPNS